jgi:hypothetical protein
MYDNAHYNGSVKIAPAANYLSGSLQISVSTNQEKQEHKFIIQKSISIKGLECAGLIKYKTLQGNNNPFMEDAKTIVLYFDKPVKEFSFILFYNLKFAINGKWETNRITRDWTELGIYAPWYPYFNNAKVTYELTINIVGDYELISIGDLKKETNYKLVCKTPQISILLLVANKFNSLISPDNTINVHWPDGLADQYPKHLLEISQDIYFSLTEMLEPTNESKINMIIANRNKAGGYVRRNYIIMQNKEKLGDNEGLFKWLSHEFGHIWWYKADTNTWQDWLNESYAEYYSLQIIKKYKGENAYQSIIHKKEKTSENKPPIKEISRRSDDAYTVLYDKGCLLLISLANFVGEAEFLEFNKELLKLKELNTNNWLELLKTKFGNEAFEIANKMLSE